MIKGYASGDALASDSRATRVTPRAYDRCPRRPLLSSQVWRREEHTIGSCVFCDIVDGRVPAHVVLSDDVVVAFLDARPVFKGHVLVAPRDHVITLADLPADEVGPYFLRVQRISAVMPAALDCQGSFVAANNVVSQSVPHLHVHIVPRTKGDGLRGFFWPRQRYDSDAEAAGYAERLRLALGAPRS